MSVESLVTKEPGDALVQKLGNSMLRTLYASFRLSQGSLFLQHNILDLAAYYYRSEHSAEALSDAHHEATEKVAKLVLPPGHTPQDPHEIHGQFMATWEYFGNGFPANGDTCHPHHPVTYGLFGHLIGGVAERDVRYLQPRRVLYYMGDSEPRIGRAVGTTGRDPRQSYTRDYLLQGASIRDEVLDHVLRDARRLVVDTRPGETCSSPALEKAFTGHFPQVASYWEEHHPGQQFIDPAAYAGSRLLESIIRTPA